MNLDTYAQTTIELHRKLNDVKYSGDIDAEYKAFWALYHDAQTHTRELLTYNRYLRVLHDHYVNIMSEKKVLNEYRTTFQIDAGVYDTVDKQEVGNQRLKFTIISRHKLREISKKEIYDFLVDPATNDLLFVYWGRDRLQYVIIPNAQLTVIEVGNIQEYA